MSNFSDTRVIAECLDCGRQAPFEVGTQNCPHCGSGWREARYDLENISKKLIFSVRTRPNNLWRFREILPVRPQPTLMMGEGGTPLIHALNLGKMLGLENLYIKDERQGPTNSFKDRQASLAVTAWKEAGIREAVLASTGNVAIAYSAYAARAGIKLWAFLTSLVPAEKMREVAVYGTQVVKVTATYDQAKTIAYEFAKQRNLHFERGSRSIPSVEAMKTLAYEIVEDLGLFLGQNNPEVNQSDGLDSEWIAPDWYLQSVSGGLGPQGVQKGFSELFEMGLIKKVPAIAGIQTEGCAPMVHAFQRDQSIAEAVVSPRTHIATLSTGDPGFTYTLLLTRMRESADLGKCNFPGGGIFEAVSDEEAYRTMHMLAKLEGLSVEPASAVAFAGLIKLVRDRIIKQNDVVVVNCTGHTMSIETDILGDNWAKNLVVSAKVFEEQPEEGILSALSAATFEKFPRVLVVDDTSDARRLIVRILKSQGDYILFEAENGGEAIQKALKEAPDLIILDLMMPEVDGFMVLDALKNDPRTSNIPVIVVTAKDLTRAEKARLQGRIHALMEKGNFLDSNEDGENDLSSQIREILK